MAAQEEESPSAVGSVMRLLQSGRVPEARLEAVLEIVCSRGNEHDLAYVYERALDEDAYPQDVRVKVLNGLVEAARTRKVMPAGELRDVNGLLASEDEEIRQAAVDLVGLWQVEEAAGALREVVTSESAGTLREKALEALVGLGAEAARPAIEALTSRDRPFTDRALGVSALVSIDVEEAAASAVELLSGAEADDDLEPLLAAFLSRQSGSAVLAEAIDANPPGMDTAKRALRYMYSVGRSDTELSGALGDLAGIDADPEPPTAEELAALIEAVNTDGDPAEGEEVFRRADLSCMKCHAVSKGGGQIGPDLSALGSSSPVDYIFTSIFDPDAAIKEAFHTRVVLTVDGDVYQGIVADDTDEELVLKDAQGVLRRIPQEDVDASREGQSLMPKGLVKFMTEEELIDLVKFLSMLGKPGEYAVRETPRMQRWRVLSPVPEPLQLQIPDVAAFEGLVLNNGTWAPAYSRVNGTLPLEELQRTIDSPVLYVQGEVDVTEAGLVGMSVTAPAGSHVWVNDESFGTTREFTTHLNEGRHRITLRIDAGVEALGNVKLELQRVAESEAEFAVVDGA